MWNGSNKTLVDQNNTALWGHTVHVCSDKSLQFGVKLIQEVSFCTEGSFMSPLIFHSSGSTAPHLLLSQGNWQLPYLLIWDSNPACSLSWERVHILEGKVVDGAGVAMWLLHPGWAERSSHWQTRIDEHCRGGSSYFCLSDHMPCPVSVSTSVCTAECVSQGERGENKQISVYSVMSNSPHVIHYSNALIITEHAECCNQHQSLKYPRACQYMNLFQVIIYSHVAIINMQSSVYGVNQPCRFTWHERDQQTKVWVITAESFHWESSPLTASPLFNCTHVFFLLSAQA